MQKDPNSLCDIQQRFIESGAGRLRQTEVQSHAGFSDLGDFLFFSIELFCARLSLSIANVVAEPALVVLTMIARCPQL